MHTRPWLALLLTLAAPSAMPAQDIQVPVDQAGRIQVISAELARRLGLFTEVDGFREARLFRLPDSTFVLELTSVVGGGLRRERRPLSAEETIALRREVTSRITARAPTAVLDQGGRTKLLVGSMILGLGYYGWATAVAFDTDDDQTAVAVYMLTAAGTFFVPYLGTRNHSIPDAVATMSLWGASRGALHGFIASELGDADADKTKFAWSVALGAAQGVAGGLVARRLNMTPGRAELTGIGGDLGLGTGFAVADLFSLDTRTRTVTADPPFTYETPDRTAQSAVILAGAGAGLAAGYMLGATDNWTRGDAVVFRNVAAMGGLTGVAIGDILHRRRLVTVANSGGPSYSYYEDGFSRTHSAAGLAGEAAGIVLGRALVSGRNFTTSQGTLLTLSPLAGGLLGLGIAYVATPERQYDVIPGAPYQDPNDHSELYLTAGAIGAGIGFAVLYPAMARQARQQGDGPDVQFSLNPLAPAQLAGGSRSEVTIATVRYRF